MKFVAVGTVLNVRTGTSKKTGKAYSVGDVYDGEDLLKIYSFPTGYKVGEACEIPCRLRITENGGCFIAAIES